MTPEQSKMLVGLLREHMEQQAEIEALKTILKTAVATNSIPVAWQDNLETIRKAPEYRRIAEKYDKQFLLAQQSTESVCLNLCCGPSQKSGS